MFFIDTSGSCISYKDRFFDSAMSLDKNKFQVRPDTYIQTKDTLGGTLVLLNTKQQRFSFNNEFYMDLNFVFDKKEKSKIIFKTPQFFIDKFGIHSNFQEIFLVGKFSEKKVADMLPNDYVLK